MMKIMSFQNMRIAFLSIQSQTVSLKKRMGLTISHLQKKPISTEPQDPKTWPATGPACQQPANQQPASREIYNIVSKNGEIEWSSSPRSEPPNVTANLIRMQPERTWMVATLVQVIQFSFRLFILDAIQKTFWGSKPQKYGIKIQFAFRAASSYAWSLHVCTGKPDGGTLEKKQGNRVALELMQRQRVIKIPDLSIFIILGCELQQQKEVLQCVWIQTQKDTVDMYQEQEIHIQHTNSKL